MADIIVSVVLIVIVGAAIRYIYKQKKAGAKCIGCPYCKSGNTGCSGCATKK